MSVEHQHFVLAEIRQRVGAQLVASIAHHRTFDL
jgi:hypothetical protein